MCSEQAPQSRDLKQLQSMRLLRYARNDSTGDFIRSHQLWILKQMFERLKSVANSLKQEINFYRLVSKDNRTPRIAKIILGVAIGYIFLPFDLIPDWIPVIGHLDDLIVVPILVIIGLKFIPEEVKRECRKKVIVHRKKT